MYEYIDQCGNKSLVVCYIILNKKKKKRKEKKRKR